MADTPTTTPIQANNLGQYAKQAFGADYAKGIASTFGAYVATDLAISIHAYDVQHPAIRQQSADAFYQDMKAVTDSKKTPEDRKAFLAQVGTAFGAHGAAATEFLEAYYDGTDNKNRVVQQTEWAAFTKEVNAANTVAYEAHAKDHVRGAVAAEGSKEFVAALGPTAKLNEEIYAYAAARSALAQGKNPIFNALERTAQGRLGQDLDAHMNGIVASQVVVQAAQNAIKAGVTGAADDLQIIQNGMDTTNPAVVGQGTKKLLLDETKFLATTGGDLSATLAGMGITGGVDASLGAPLPAGVADSGPKSPSK